MSVSGLRASPGGVDRNKSTTEKIPCKDEGRIKTTNELQFGLVLSTVNCQVIRVDHGDRRMLIEILL